MAIERLDFYGYRSFEQATWEPGNLNLLVGPNGSGKSNLLRLLELISNVARGKLAESINQAGGMVPLLWNQEARSFGWKLTLKNEDFLPKSKLHLVVHDIEISSSFGSGYSIDNEGLASLKTLEQGETEIPDWVYRRDGTKAWFDNQGTKQDVSTDEFNSDESLISPGNFGPSPLTLRLTQGIIVSWCVYQTINVSQDAPLRQPVITQPAESVLPDASNLAAVLHTFYTSNRDFKQRIDEGMRAAFGDEFVEIVFQPASAQRIQLAIQWRSSKQPHAGLELSDGTLRFLFLLTVLASPEPPRLIAIDEPEVGLHPSMFPIVAEYAAEAAAEQTQVVLSSHSPEFLDAFTEHAPHVTVCHWEEGKTRLFSLAPEKLKKWLETYRLGHLFTSGDLDALAAPEVDVDDAEDRLADLPPEDAPLPPGSSDTEGAARG